MLVLGTAMKLLSTSKPTATKAISALRKAGVLEEITGKRRNRVYAYRKYLNVLAKDTELASRRRPGKEAKHNRLSFGGL